MATSSEIELVQPLSDEEIKQGIAHKVAEAVLAALERYGPLYGKSYPKFRVFGSFSLVLDDFGLMRESAHHVIAGDMEGQGEAEGRVLVEVPVEIPETPPNLFRRETEQPVQTMVVENGRQTQKAVMYQPKRGRGRPAKGV